MTTPQMFTPLQTAITEVESYVASRGWDQPHRLFVLANTRAALADNPNLAAALPQSAHDAAANDAEHLTAIEQDGLPAHDSIEELLGQIAFGPAVNGVALAVERIMVPPEAEADLPTDHDAAIAYLMEHPNREDVRLVAGVLRDGTTSCAVRSRSNDQPELVATGDNLVPGLTSALATTLIDDEDPTTSGV